MSSQQDLGATAPRSGGQLEDAVTTFSDAVFEATQGLLKAQQELTRALLTSRTGQAQTDVDEEPAKSGGEQGADIGAVDAGGEEHGGELDDEADELDDEADEVDDEADGADGADELDDEADEAQDQRPDERRRPRSTTAGRRTTSGAAT